MKRPRGHVDVVFVVCLILMWVICLLSHCEGRQIGYRAGLIDAAGGKARAVLVTQPDGKPRWEIVETPAPKETA